MWLRLRGHRLRERQLQARVEERTTELSARLQELQDTRERLVQAEKMAAVGTLASGVGHESNNPLAFIISNLHYVTGALRELTKREEESGRWQEVEQALSEAKVGAERVRRRYPSSTGSNPVGDSAAGCIAEPLWQLAEQLLLLFTDPRHVAVRPQQHRGHVQLLADVDDVVDPVCPARH